jgi:hypothetical protein
VAAASGEGGWVGDVGWVGMGEVGCVGVCELSPQAVNGSTSMQIRAQARTSLRQFATIIRFSSDAIRACSAHG